MHLGAPKLLEAMFEILWVHLYTLVRIFNMQSFI